MYSKVEFKILQSGIFVFESSESRETTERKETRAMKRMKRGLLE